MGYQIELRPHTADALSQRNLCRIHSAESASPSFSLLQHVAYVGFSCGNGENEPTRNRRGSVNFCGAILPLSVACVSARADAGGAHCSTEGQS